MAGSNPKELLFVFHGQKQSKRNQELQDARRRAHAARHAARKTKELMRDANLVLINDSDAGSDARFFVHRPQRGPVRRYPALPSIESLLGHDEDGGSSAQSTTTSPLGYLSQDLSDPFQTTIVGTLPTVLQRYLHDAQTLIWPAMVPLVPSHIAAFFYRRSPVDSPSEIDHQIDAAAAISLAFIQAHSPRDRCLLPQIAAIGRKHRERSIAWVNSKVVNAHGPPPSNVVGALLSLVSHSGLGSPQIQTKWQLSPLAMGQFSALFGSSRVLPEDMRFLHAVVELKGGDSWVASEIMDEDMPLKLMLNHFDIFVSTRLGTPPMWRSMASVPADVLARYNTSSNTGDTVDCPTSPIRTLCLVLQSPTVRAAMEIMQIATNMLDLEFTNSPNAPLRSVLVHTRNMAQHQLLMLYDGPDHSQATPKLQGTTRLQGLDAVAHPAILLFSDLVLFVLPPTSGSRIRLLRELLSSLCAVSFRPQRTTAQSLTEEATQYDPPAHRPNRTPSPTRPTSAGRSSSQTSRPSSSAQACSPTGQSPPQHPTANRPPPSPRHLDTPDRHPTTSYESPAQHLHLWALLILAIGSLTHIPSSPAEVGLVAEIDNYCLSYLSTQTVVPAVAKLEEEGGVEGAQSGSWEQLRDVMRKFLWWDYVLEEPAREVWRRAVEIRERRGGDGE